MGTRPTSRVVCGSLEVVQSQPLKVLPSHMMALVLSNDRMSEIQNSSFSGLDVLDRPLWPMLLPKAMLVSMAHSPRLC